MLCGREVVRPGAARLAGFVRDLHASRVVQDDGHRTAGGDRGRLEADGSQQDQGNGREREEAQEHEQRQARRGDEPSRVAIHAERKQDEGQPAEHPGPGGRRVRETDVQRQRDSGRRLSDW